MLIYLCGADLQISPGYQYSIYLSICLLLLVSSSERSPTWDGKDFTAVSLEVGNKELRGRRAVIGAHLSWINTFIDLVIVGTYEIISASPSFPSGEHSLAGDVLFLL